MKANRFSNYAKVGFVILILLLHTKYTTTTEDAPCVTLDVGSYCYSNDTNPYRLYSSKTKYSYVNNNVNDTLNLNGCTPKALYLFSRHAARYPKEKYINYIDDILPELKDKILKASKEGKGNMCKEDLQLLNEWSPTYDPENTELISLSGAFEARDLGERLRQKFPSLLGLPYSPEVFTIQYTHRNRTRQTAEDFCQGVFSTEDYININFDGKENDEILQFHKQCEKIMNKCAEPNYDTSEYDKFKNSQLQKDVYDSMSKRTGLNINQHEQKRMYRACSFSYAMLGNTAWCTVFSPDELKVTEFSSDLKEYYKDAYGNKMNTESPCPVIKYIVDFFKNFESTKQPNVTLHFSHSGAITKLYSMFGLFRDDHPLTADHYCQQKDRKWRSSYICPFTSNIVLVLYECNGEYNVVILQNEKPVIIDGCDDYICPLSNFYDYYGPIGNNCDLEKICYNCKKE